MSDPLLCRLGHHKKYKYLPKVGGDLGEICIACKRCGYGYRYFAGTWDIPPEQVQEDIKRQASVEFGRVVGIFEGVGYERVASTGQLLQAAFDTIKETGKFTDDELKPVRDHVERQSALEATLAREIEKAPPAMRAMLSSTQKPRLRYIRELIGG